MTDDGADARAVDVVNLREIEDGETVSHLVGRIHGLLELREARRVDEPLGCQKSDRLGLPALQLADALFPGEFWHGIQYKPVS